MPFTLAHPVAVLPLLRTRLVAPGLVVGSMAPDLSYFAALRPLDGDVTHSWWGLVVVDLPLALAFLVVFERFTAPALVALGPRWVRERVAGRVAPTPVTPALLGSILVGGVTHVVWDAFTHYDGFAVLRMRWLKHDVVPGLPIYQFLQMGGSAVGVAFLTWWVLRRLRRTDPGPVPAHLAPPARPLVPIAWVLGAAAVVGLGNGLRGMAAVGEVPVLDLLAAVPTTKQWQTGVVLACIGAISAAFAALACYGVLRGRVTSTR
ncbi:DUF4184 family protein [Actinokineospora bangkokensis]|uniref:DUF4184 domain-containing protein n=1 Tax=Actinokineospora bangkokensis TaxID=1193682 RepID=A0A1Q9LBV4_9PSEU|nr:DUF4184 family protein [Actinokineospora bangkokensis]OLR89499.1 hypothetical protein BJP25_05290 [Actinokineospora bangkokensis]